MDTIARVEELAAERDLTLYSLSHLCDVPYTTLVNAKKRGGQLTVDTIERICIGLHISFRTFFPENEPNNKLS